MSSTSDQTTATVVVATDFGGPEVLSLVEQELRAPSAGEVTIAVRAAAINPIDHKLVRGMRGADRSLLPMRVGMELSGVVTAVGGAGDGLDTVDGVDGPVRVGDEVVAYPCPVPGRAR